MGFRNDAYATVWQVDGKSRTMTVVRITTSRKDRDTGTYVQDFSGYVAFVGADNAAKALELHEKDRIKLGHVDVSAKYDKEKKREFVNYTCFGFELQKPAEKKEEEAHVEDGGDTEEQISDGELPF